MGYPPPPPLQVALRSYALGLSFSTIPALLPVLASYATRKHTPSSNWNVLRTLRIELGPTGFAFAMAVAAGGGACLNFLCTRKKGDENPDISKRAHLRTWLRTLACNAVSSSVAIYLLHSRRRGSHISTSPLPLTFPFGSPRAERRVSPTLDLSLLLLVRALDAVVEQVLSSTPPKSNTNTHSQREKKRARVDAVIFWLSCSRIMWCFFYEPQKLPGSYLRWISSLAAIDPRIPITLRAIRARTWVYGTVSTMYPTLLSTLSSELGYPPSWGKPEVLPSKGGNKATTMLHALGIMNRDQIGGLPCEIVHGGVGGGSCLANATIRGFKAFCKAAIIYFPVHVLPTLILQPTKLLTSPLVILTSVCRSATFLATFVASIWFFVCFTRTLVLARIFPHIPHLIWDGPYGCVLFGSLMCGGSIFIESGRRRAEIALYVLPRAVRACLNDSWVKSTTSGKRVTERLVFILSLAYLLTASALSPHQLRGLSRWTLTFVMNGPRLKLTRGK